MPELPEVEICARNLRRWCLGRRIEVARALPGTPLRDISARRFSALLVGRRFSEVVRHGKQLIIELDQDQILLMHLGMTGKVVRLSALSERRPGLRARWQLDDQTVLGFVDPRRFGRLRLLPKAQALAHSEIVRLGPDALGLLGERGGLQSAVGASQSPIKIALLDQSRVAGIGNIHACEGLFRAKLDPFLPARSLTPPAFSRLSSGILASFRHSLGSEDGGEVRYLGESEAVNIFRVYGRAGERCSRCKNAEIERSSQGGRGTFFCPNCQLGHVS